MILIYKGKRNPLNTNSYKGIKLLDYAFKLYERILDKRMKKVEGTDEMQYSFMSGKGTFDAVFILRRLTEKYRLKGKNLFCVFVDLKKVFDREQISCFLFDMLLPRVRSNHRLNTAYQTFLVPKSFRYSCHCSYISNGAAR